MSTSINLDFGSKDFKIAGLESKFDFVGVPNSFVRCFEAQLNRFEITVLYQLLRWHSWSNSGVVLRGVKWIYKSVASMIEDAFRGIKPGKLYRALNKLVRLGFLLQEQLHREHYGDVHACAAYNRRNYYSPIMEKVMGCIVDTLTEKSPQTLENLGFSIKENQSCQNESTDFSKQKNNTHTTSTSIPPHTPPQTPPGGIESEPTKPDRDLRSKLNQESQKPSNPKFVGQNAVSTQPVPFTDVVARPPRVEQKINKKSLVQKPVQTPEVESVPETVLESSSPEAVEPEVLPVKPKSKRRQKKTPKGTKPQQDFGLAPWKSLEQFRKFYRALIASPYVRRMAKNLEALVSRIVADLKQGVPHPFWDDFIAGRPIGSSTRCEWQNEVGDPHPKFIEYLAEKLIKGNNTQTREIAIAEALKIASDPRQAKFFWKEFKIVLNNISERISEDRALGISTPNIPVWARERVEPTVEAALIAGEKVAAVDAATQNALDAARQEKKQLQAVSRSAIAPAKDTNSTDSSDPWLDEDSPPDKPSLRDLAAQRWGHHKLKPYEPKKARERVSPKKQSKKPLNIDEMTVEEINQALTDPILRGDLTPQLMLSDYEVITDEVGAILAVKPPPIE